MPNTVYLDLVEFLNGYSANQTIADTVEHYAVIAGSASAGSWSVYIGADDKVRLLANMAFTVTHSSGTDWMGIGAGRCRARRADRPYRGASRGMDPRPRRWSFGVLD